MRQLYVYDYVDRDYAGICELLEARAARVLQAATDDAVDRATTIGARLTVPVGHLDIGRDITVELGPFDRARHLSRLPLKWKATIHAALFPSMTAALELMPLVEGGDPVTQVSIIGEYHAPLGVVGRVADAVAGHRLAEASL